MKNHIGGTKSILWLVKSCIRCTSFWVMWNEEYLVPAPKGHLVPVDKLQSISDITFGLFDWVIYEHSRIPIRNVCHSTFRYMRLNSHMLNPFAYVGHNAVTTNMLRFNNFTALNMLHAPLLWLLCLFRTNVGFAIVHLAYWRIYVQKEWLIIC